MTVCEKAESVDKRLNKRRPNRKRSCKFIEKTFNEIANPYIAYYFKLLGNIIIEDTKQGRSKAVAREAVA